MAIYKMINGQKKQLIGAFKNINGTIVPLHKIEKKFLTKDREEIFYVSAAFNSMTTIAQGLIDHLVVINADPLFVTNLLAGITYTGVNGNGDLVVQNQNGLDIKVPLQGLLNNDDVVNIVLSPKPGFKVTGQSVIQVTIPHDAFTLPVKTINITDADMQDIIDHLVYTGPNGTGTIMGTDTADYEVKITPRDTNSNGDTFKIELIAKAQRLLTGTTTKIVQVPPNSFLDIHSSTWAQLLARFTPTLNFGGYEGSGTINPLIAIPAGVVTFTPNAGLSSGDTITANIVLQPGYDIDGHDSTQGIYTHDLVIPPNSFHPNPHTQVDPAVALQKVISSLALFGFDGTGTAFGQQFNEFEYTLSKKNGLSNGDDIDITITAKPGYHLTAGATTQTFTIPDNTFFDTSQIGTGGAATGGASTVKVITNKDEDRVAGSDWVSNTQPTLTLKHGVIGVAHDAFNGWRGTTLTLNPELKTIGRNAFGAVYYNSWLGMGGNLHVVVTITCPAKFATQSEIMRICTNGNAPDPGKWTINGVLFENLPA